MKQSYHVQALLVLLFSESRWNKFIVLGIVGGSFIFNIWRKQGHLAKALLVVISFSESEGSKDTVF